MTVALVVALVVVSLYAIFVTLAVIGMHMHLNRIKAEAGRLIAEWDAAVLELNGVLGGQHKPVKITQYSVPNRMN